MGYCCAHPYRQSPNNPFSIDPPPTSPHPVSQKLAGEGLRRPMALLSSKVNLAELLHPRNPQGLNPCPRLCLPCSVNVFHQETLP